MQSGEPPIARLPVEGDEHGHQTSWFPAVRQGAGRLVHRHGADRPPVSGDPTRASGQILIVIWGCGRVQREGGPVEEIRPGDVIWFEPGEKHWHGASPTTAMTHIAIQEALDGKAVEWMEKVSDEQYQA
jgi:mannose-6-phosphate isomerase-like protein (cupin superfamily)